MLADRSCPNCGSGHKSLVFTSTDYSISKEEFSIVQCMRCALCFTNPIPDINDIGRYYASQEYISHSDIKTGFINKVYHQVRKYTLNQKVSLIYKLNSQKAGRLLDVGCGTGAFAKTCQKNHWQVEGMEPDTQANRMASEMLQKSIYTNLLEINGTLSFDIITLWHVLEHIHDINESIKKLKSLLMPQGHLLIAVPNFESYDSQYYKQYWAAYDLPRHLYHFSKASMTAILAKHQLSVIQILPMRFDAFYVSLLSEKYKNSSNFILKYLRPFFIGLKSNLNGSINHSSLIYIVTKND